jgi:exodeoxyribonuclease VII small subunit
VSDPTPDPMPADQLGYAEALRELESIVAELEREAVDVDHLSDRVRRASELVRALRQRIGTARMEVSRVLSDLDAAVSEVADDQDATDGAR